MLINPVLSECKEKNMSKRYVFFVGTLWQGGAERVISILSKQMTENNLDVKILLYYDGPLFYELDQRVKVDVVEKNTKSRNILKNILWMRKYFKDQADVVISFLASFNILSLIATFGLQTSIIVADRNDPRHVPQNRYIRFARDVLYRLSDGVVIQTKHNQTYFQQKIQDNSVVISNPVDLGKKAGMALRTEKRREIVSVGRLMPQKNQSMLIEAFSRIHKKYAEYRLVIYGDGPYRKIIENQIQEHGLQDYILLPGTVKDLHDRIACAELFVLTSNYEGMPNALTEAMCLGLPVISTEVSGATELIQDGENGLLVPCGDIEKMIVAMERMLGDDKFRKCCAMNAVQLNEKLAVDVILEKWTKYAEQM